MSDLILNFDGIQAAPQACAEAPPPSGADPCHFTLPLVDDASPTAAPHLVRFDRQGDQFVLSQSNPGDTLTWVASHRNLATLLETLRLTQGMVRGTGFHLSEVSTRIFLVIANYVATGEVLAPGRTGESVDRAELANALLDIFTDSDDRALSDFLGRLSLIRGQDWLPGEARDRLRWVMDVIDFGPAYRAFRRHFLSEEEYRNFEALPQQRREQFQAITNFVRELIVAQALQRPLRYLPSFLEANTAYQALYREELRQGTREEFCVSLEAALRELRGDRGVPANFMEDCREALRLLGLSPEEALRQSLQRFVLSGVTLRRLQESVAGEGEAANMPVNWLVRQGAEEQGGRIGEVFRVLLNHLQVTFPAESGAAPSVSLDVPAFSLDLNTLIDAQPLRRREYLISALALLRTFFGREGAPPPIRVFVNGEHQDIFWQLSPEQLTDLRRLTVSVRSRLQTSETRTDIVLPLLEGAVCALGIGGLVLNESLPEIRADEGLHLGIGTSSAALTGAGCTSLLGHFFWPEVADVHNSYLWDGLTGLGGAVVGAGLYLLLNFLLGTSATGGSMRFPVDEYGP